MWNRNTSTCVTRMGVLSDAVTKFPKRIWIVLVEVSLRVMITLVFGWREYVNTAYMKIISSHQKTIFFNMVAGLRSSDQCCVLIYASIRPVTTELGRMVEHYGLILPRSCDNVTRTTILVIIFWNTQGFNTGPIHHKSNKTWYLV